MSEVEGGEGGRGMQDGPLEGEGGDDDLLRPRLSRGPAMTDFDIESLAPVLQESPGSHFERYSVNGSHFVQCWLQSKRDALQDLSIHELSGGQVPRVAMAVVLFHLCRAWVTRAGLGPADMSCIVGP